MKISNRIAAAMIAMVVATGISAAPFNGKDLHGWLASDDGALRLAGQMYVLGIVDDDARRDVGVKNVMTGKSDLGNGRQICISPGVKPTELATLVAQRLSNDRSLVDQPAGFAVVSELASRFPCRSVASSAKEATCTDLSTIAYFAASSSLSTSDRRQLDELKAEARQPNKARPAIADTFISRAELAGSGSHGNAGEGLKNVDSARYDGLLTALYQFKLCMNQGPTPLR